MHCPGAYPFLLCQSYLIAYVRHGIAQTSASASVNLLSRLMTQQYVIVIHDSLMCIISTRNFITRNNVVVVLNNQANQRCKIHSVIANVFIALL